MGFLFFPVGKSANADGSSDLLSSRINASIINEDSFYIGYPLSRSKAHVIDPQIIINKMKEANVEVFNIPNTNCNNYNIMSRGKILTYRPDSGIFIGRDGNIRCRFYATNSNLDNINTIITIIGGTGSRIGGEDFDNVALPPNAIIVVCYSGDADVNMLDRANTVADCTEFANHVFLRNKSFLHNCIVGTSEGAQTAFITVSNNPGLYQTLVCSNGSAYWDKGKINLLSERSYRSFEDMEIIFLESKNNNYWNESVVQTINDLISHGIMIENTYLYTNDSYFNCLKDLLCGNLFLLSDNELLRYGKWEKHGDGMKMITDSNILCYLSGRSHVDQYSKLNINSIEEHNLGRK